MPFTFSHPAILIPLRFLPKNWFSITGLIVGSLIPDFEYFIRLRLKSDHSHTLFGLLWFDIPVSILICFIFHLIVRKKLIENLPNFLKSRFWDYRNFDWITYFSKNWYKVIISILIGSLSHIFWDSFTHEHGFFVEKINFLNNTIIVQEIKFPVYKLLQKLSTFIGGLSILIFILSLPKNKFYNKQNIIYFWLLVLILLSIFFIGFSTLQSDLTKVGHKITILISSFLMSIIFSTFFFKKF